MRLHANAAIATNQNQALPAHMRMRRRTRTKDSAEVHQTLFLLLGVGSGNETTRPSLRVLVMQYIQRCGGSGLVHETSEVIG